MKLVHGIGKRSWWPKREKQALDDAHPAFRSADKHGGCELGTWVSTRNTELRYDAPSNSFRDGGLGAIILHEYTPDECDAVVARLRSADPKQGFKPKWREHLIKMFSDRTDPPVHFMAC
jgi:hypothetical protein